MRISIVLTTYNAGTHLKGQLDSIRAQSLPPDEVLIFDDGSTDGTVVYLEEYLREYDLKHWKLRVNRQNLGWKRNFMEGLRTATGDLLFPCDQDDIWYPEKLEEMTTAMGANPEILLLACDYRVVYEPGALKAKIYKKTEAEKQGRITKYGFTKHFFMNPNPGCSYAVRRTFFDEVNSLWFEDSPHDEFLWLMAAIQDGAWFYNKVLMDYVRYSDNASGIHYKDIALQQENLCYIHRQLSALQAFAVSHSGKVKEAYKCELSNAQIWCAKRKKLMETRNPLRWLAMAPYWGYYNSPKNCLSDLWLVVFGSFRRRRK